MINQIVAASMLGEGIIFGLIAFVLFRKKNAKLVLCQRIWGDVIEVKERTGGESPTRHPVIRYQAATGEDVTFESKYGSSNWKVKPGDRLEILVNPDNPTDAEVVGFMAQWGIPVILAIVAVSSIIGAPIVFILMKN